MAKQHNTIPNEQPEMPIRKEEPEIYSPSDPKEPEIPKENPDQLPEELPPVKNPQEDPPLNPG